jgi:hypothetical protein
MALAAVHWHAQEAKCIKALPPHILHGHPGASQQHARELRVELVIVAKAEVMQRGDQTLNGHWVAGPWPPCLAHLG